MFQNVNMRNQMCEASSVQRRFRPPEPVRAHAIGVQVFVCVMFMCAVDVKRSCSVYFFRRPVN
eukprot:5027262-Pyramimonas_sp.AAC.1